MKVADLRQLEDLFGGGLEPMRVVNSRAAVAPGAMRPAASNTPTDGICVRRRELKRFSWALATALV